MDGLSELLEDIRFRGRLYCRVEAREPWGLSAPPSGVATFHGVLRGAATLRLQPDDRTAALRAGDLVVLSHGSGHAIADSRASMSRTGADGATTPISIETAVAAARGSLVRTGGSGARASLVCGAFFTDSRDLPPLFSFLPPLLHVPATEGGSTLRGLLALLAAESDRDDGSHASIARLTEALFVHAMRTWARAGDPSSSTWLAAMREPKIGAALAQIHRRPAHDWTVDSLARTVGMSRAAFAGRFHTIVGEPPVSYLTRWRIYLAARALRETVRTVAEIATTVGYETEASLNRAFKRVMGVPPGAYRRSAA